MNLPQIDFLIIGAAKCATTSFHHYLSAHPDIFLPMRHGINQETGFFLAAGEESIKGVTNDMIRKDVQRIFDDYREESTVGERATDYSKFPLRTVDFAKIKTHNPRMKFLYFVAEPVERVKKLYRHHLRRNPANTDPDFRLEMEKSGLYYECVCSYFAQAKRYVDFFGEESIRIIDVNRLEDNLSRILPDIFRFLDVREYPVKILGKKFNVNACEASLADCRLPRPMEERLRQDYSLLLERSRSWGNYWERPEP